MEALAYLRAKNRMTNKCRIGCSYCPLSSSKNGKHMPCSQLEHEFPEETVAIVERWSKEYPLKTYAQDIFEKFPNAIKDANGLPILCKRHVYGGECTYNCPACWNSPMEEYND